MSFLLVACVVGLLYALLFSLSRIEKKQHQYLDSQHSKLQSPVQKALHRRSQSQQRQKTRANTANRRAAEARQTFRENQEPLTPPSSFNNSFDAFNQQETRINQAQKRMNDDRSVDKGSSSSRIQPQQKQQQQSKQQQKKLAQEENDRSAKVRQEFRANQQQQQEIEADRQRLLKEQQAQQPHHSRIAYPANKPQIPQVLQSKLEKLCGNDARLAQRLVRQIQAKHGDRSEQWCWEKAIWDMEKDRRQ